MPVRIFHMSSKSLDETLAESNSKNTETQKLMDKEPEVVVEAKKGITFAFQDKLKKLPIPDLEESCRKYLEVAKPLQGHREYKETVAAVREFLGKDGPKLQEKLQAYAATQSSYIEQFWYDSYLNYDNPVVLNLNPFFLLADDPTPARNNQLTRAASLVVSSLSFIRALRREELPPDEIRGQKLCMDQFSRIFGAARIPTENGCQMHTDSKSKHMIVMCRSQFYWFDVLDTNADIVMTEKDIVANLQAIVEDASNTSILDAARSAVGVLSTENRRVWAGLRNFLDNDEVNKDCLKIVDTALFVLCLDDTEPQTLPEVSSNMLCGSSVVEKGVQIGTCTNRWYDKLQIIVCHNGSAGINFEHTGVDGHTILRFASDIYTDTILRFAKTINGAAPSMWSSTSPDPSKRDPASFGNISTIPHKLEWNMKPELLLALRFAETRLADLIHQNEFETMEFEGYGASYMKSAGFSPDAFVQMAFQAAYYVLYGRVECTYEPAMTKQFLHGRTEAIRSVSTESVDFVRKFCEDAPAKDKIEALKKACVKHSATTKECSKGLGQDRHLYALYCLWQRGLIDGSDVGNSPSGTETDEYNGYASDPADGSVMSDESAVSSSTVEMNGNKVPRHVPQIFADSAWDKLNTTILSTSNCGNPSLRMFGFGPTSGDGYGIGYIIKDDSISVCVSSKHRQTKRYVDTLHNYLVEVRHLLRQTQKASTGSPLQSRAREAEKPAPVLPSKKSIHGKKIFSKFMSRPGYSSDEDSGEDGGMLGGYGFFDVGNLEHLFHDKHVATAADKALTARKSVGRKLMLAQY